MFFYDLGIKDGCKNYYFTIISTLCVILSGAGEPTFGVC